ncbi:hypothetical protein [Arthrobacter sp. NicSoilB8]|uniref:hypothetical protein n=1 Tax=Arthrobacter sp. NicSoilB8 TaxID=2830998 RepID=UPI001CC6DF35|nr:hypothetical protein [Arthrobacter sp. NicSoilB8]BCW70479.1 hypothetical protein NicSoilB8_15230 [Arthrobacter sp. NicSoilB8]
MTELNQEPDPALTEALDHAAGPGAQPERAEAAEASPAADVAWPALPSQRSAAGHRPRADQTPDHEAPDYEAQGHEPEGAEAPAQDPAVSAVLDRLAAVRLTPVSGHGELYADMHDSLLEALNEDVASRTGVAHRIHAARDGGS